MLRKRFLLAVLLLAPFLPAAGQQLSTLRTKDLDLIYYDKAHEYLSYHLARSFENSLAFHEKLFDYKPSEPVVVLMQDFGDYGHGGTSTVPWNYISIGIEPFDYVYETMPANERMNWLMHHELVHVVATDKAAGSDLFFRKVFRGKVAPIKENPLSMFYSYLTSPRWYSPRWYHEGIAVFMETWMAGGVGRVLGGYDEMVFRTMALEDAYFYDVVGLESEGTTIDFQVGQNSYLYGTRFVTWLALRYGPEKVIAWFNRSEGSRRYFSAQFANVFGTSLDQAWREWIAWEHQWQHANVERIRRYPVTAGKGITNEVLGSVSRSFYDRDRGLLYAAVNRPARPAQIVAIDVRSGKITPLAEVKGPALYFVTSLAYDPKGRKIFFTTDNSMGWRDLNEVDLATGRTRQLLANCRTGDLVVNPADQSIWGIQHNNGLSTIVRIPRPYNEWKSIQTIDYGRDIFDIDLSPDGRTLSASMIDVTGRQQLVLFDVDHLMKGDSHFDVAHEFENNSPENFTFSPDGRFLYGTSYYSGVSNVFRYDLATKKIEAVTNAETGYFRPIAAEDATLIAYRYTSRGFSPEIIPVTVHDDIEAIHYLGQEVVEKHDVVKSWNAGSPARVNLDQVTTYHGLYRPIARVRLGSLYPVVEGYKNTAAAGLRFNFADPLALNTFDVTAAYSPDHSLQSNERLHLKLDYERPPWKVRSGYNATNFYDLFGPTRTSRKGLFQSVAYHQYAIFDRPRTLEYTITAAHYSGLDTLPDYQNVAAPFSEYSTLNAHLDYSDLRRTIGAVDYERGSAWSVTAAASAVQSEILPQVLASFDHGFLLPLDHSSLWLRAAAGRSLKNSDNVFNEFFFGAFGNNWIDYQEVRRYRDVFSFPGLALNEAGGRNFARGGVEWTLPPLRFRRVGVPGLYANWARLALFSSQLATYTESGGRWEKWRDVGAQVDLSLVMFSNLESTLSVGYAAARRAGKTSDEVMLSLKLLR